MKETKDYLEKLYVEDGNTLGLLDAEEVQTKVPAPALTTKAWALSVSLWQSPKKAPDATVDPPKLATKCPASITAYLTIVEKLGAQNIDAMKEDDLLQLGDAAIELQTLFGDLEMQNTDGTANAEAQKAVNSYADLAKALQGTVSTEVARRKSEAAEKLEKQKELEKVAA